MFYGIETTCTLQYMYIDIAISCYSELLIYLLKRKFGSFSGHCLPENFQIFVSANILTHNSVYTTCTSTLVRC